MYYKFIMFKKYSWNCSSLVACSQTPYALYFFVPLPPEYWNKFVPFVMWRLQDPPITARSGEFKKPRVMRMNTKAVSKWWKLTIFCAVKKEDRWFIASKASFTISRSNYWRFILSKERNGPKKIWKCKNRISILERIVCVLVVEKSRASCLFFSGSFDSFRRKWPGKHRHPR